MHQITLEAAQNRLGEILAAAIPGEEIQILQNDHVVAKLVTLDTGSPRPRFGSAKGSILYMAEDFDAPLDDFKEYMERGSFSTRMPSSGSSWATRS